MEDAAPGTPPEDPVMKTVEILVSGRVQRVGFRACVRKLAISLTVNGEVMNLPDGRVRIVATGEEIILEKFISSLYGCPRAVVRDVVVTPCEPDGSTTFTIERNGV